MSPTAEVPAVDKRTVTVAGAGLGASLAATLATACCVPILAPLIVAVLGVSGAVWAAGLKPYGLYILAASLAVLAFGFWMIYRPRQMPDGAVCPTRRPRAVVWMIWTAAGLWVFAMLLNTAPGLLLWLAGPMGQS